MRLEEELSREDARPQAERYEIRIRENLDPAWSEWFEGFKIERIGGKETVLSGPVTDQPALQGLLARIWDLNLTVIAVRKLDIEEAQNGDESIPSK